MRKAVLKFCDEFLDNNEKCQKFENNGVFILFHFI